MADSDETSCISVGDLALSHTDDPGGDIDDLGGGSTSDWVSFISNFTTSASPLSKTPALGVSSSSRVSLLKSTADVVE